MHLLERSLGRSCGVRSKILNMNADNTDGMENPRDAMMALILKAVRRLARRRVKN